MRKLSIAFFMAISIGSLSLPLQAEVSVPHNFSAGQKAVADEVNKNFATLVAALNAALARIDALEAENQTLISEVSAIKGNSALELGGYVEVLDGPEVHGYTTVRFTGVNLQVVDGSGETNIYRGQNGLGNLIVGYNEAGGIEMCSVAVADEATCLSGDAVYSDTHKTGSHNLVVGAYHNYTGSAGLVAGHKNGITSKGASVTGGTENLAGFDYASVSGGSKNKAGGLQSIVVGGLANEADFWNSVVVGGEGNGGRTNYGVVIGGKNNRVIRHHSVILGGVNNQDTGPEQIIPEPPFN